MSEGDEVPLALSHSPLPHWGRGDTGGMGQNLKFGIFSNNAITLTLSNPRLRKVSYDEAVAEEVFATAVIFLPAAQKLLAVLTAHND